MKQELLDIIKPQIQAKAEELRSVIQEREANGCLYELDFSEMPESQQDRVIESAVEAGIEEYEYIDTKDLLTIPDELEEYVEDEAVRQEINEYCADIILNRG